MNVIGQLIDDREDRQRDEALADTQWMLERSGIDPAERLEAWRRWLRKTLETTLQWPANPAAKERLIGQCAAEITTLARQLRGRGWLLEGKALADHVKALLGPVAAAQKAGKIGDFWPYFRAAVKRYVGANAEEIQAHARRTGADESAQSMAGALAALGIGKALTRGPSMTEIIADRDAAKRQAEADQRAAEKAQLKLL